MITLGILGLCGKNVVTALAIAILAFHFICYVCAIMIKNDIKTDITSVIFNISIDVLAVLHLCKVNVDIAFCIICIIFGILVIKLIVKTIIDM